MEVFYLVAEIMVVKCNKWKYSITFFTFLAFSCIYLFVLLKLVSYLVKTLDLFHLILLYFLLLNFTHLANFLASRYLFKLFYYSFYYYYYLLLVVVLFYSIWKLDKPIAFYKPTFTFK